MKYIKNYELSSYNPKNNGKIKKGSYIFITKFYDDRCYTKDKPYKVLSVNDLGYIKIYNNKGVLDTIAPVQYEKVNKKDIKFLLAANKYNL
jgi:hypothetical protein